MRRQGMEVIAVHHQRSPKEAANQGILLDAILADLNARIQTETDTDRHRRTDRDRADLNACITSSAAAGTEKGVVAGATPGAAVGATRQVAPEPTQEPEPEPEQPQPQPQPPLDPFPASQVQLQPLPPEAQQTQPQPLAPRTALVPAHGSPPATGGPTTAIKTAVAAAKETTSAGVGAPVLAAGTERKTDTERETDREREARRLAKIRGISARPASASPRLRCASLALAPWPLIFSCKSEKSLCGTEPPRRAETGAPR